MEMKTTPIQKNKSWFSVKMAGDKAEILIYDEIGFYGVSAKDLIEALDTMKVPQIDVRLNTPGGDFFDGVAIYNALVSHDAEIHMYVDGLAASAGSLIAMAGDKIFISENAFLMIHNPWTIAVGEAEELRSSANRLDKIGAAAVKTYAGRSGLHTQQVVNIMNAESWIGADEAVEMGFATEVVNEAGVNAMMKGHHDLSNFSNVPEPLKNVGEYDTINSIRPKDLERALRDAGASRTEAKTILSGGLPELRRDADDRKQVTEMISEMDALLGILKK